MAAEGGKRVWSTCAFLQSFLKPWRQGERVKKGGSDQVLREQAASPVNLPVIVFSWSSWERGSRPGPALPRPTPGGSASQGWGLGGRAGDGKHEVILHTDKGLPPPPPAPP